MTQSDVIFIGAAIVAFFVLTKKKSVSTEEIDPDGDAGGWRYFTDGTAIGPDGAYYFKGTKVYSAGGLEGASP